LAPIDLTFFCPFFPIPLEEAIHIIIIMSMTKQQFEEQQKAHLKKVAETRAKIEAKYPIVKAKPATTCAGALIVDSDAKKIYEYLAQPSVVYSIPIGNFFFF